MNLVGNLTHDRKISRNLLRLDPSYTDNGASLECFVTHPWGSRRRSHPAAGFQGCRYEKLDVRHQPVVECPDPQVILVLLISNYRRWWCDVHGCLEGSVENQNCVLCSSIICHVGRLLGWSFHLLVHLSVCCWYYVFWGVHGWCLHLYLRPNILYIGYFHHARDIHRIVLVLISIYLTIIVK